MNIQKLIICDKINEMNVQEILLSKNGMAIVKIAEILLSAEIGEKIPTVAELTKSTGLANGTVHHALTNRNSCCKYCI